MRELLPVLESHSPGLRFDCLVGRNVLMREENKGEVTTQLALLLSETGIIVLAETVPRHSQRLYRLLQPNWLEDKLYERLIEAEEAIYQVPSDAMVNWDVKDLQAAFEAAGLEVAIKVEPSSTAIALAPTLMQRWFPTTESRGTSYSERLAARLTKDEVNAIQQAFRHYLSNQTVPWTTTIAFLQARTPIR